MIEKECEILIIGAGPSGLASANYCLLEGVNFFLIDKGKKLEDRNHNDPNELINGVGGAGLFSDGKISYYPSSHILYYLPSSLLLEKAFLWFHNLVSDIILEPPDYPKNVMSEEWYYKNIGKHFMEKSYQSIYLNDGQMKEILKNS